MDDDLSASSGYRRQLALDHLREAKAAVADDTDDDAASDFEEDVDVDMESNK